MCMTLGAGIIKHDGCLIGDICWCMCFYCSENGEARVGWACVTGNEIPTKPQDENPEYMEKYSPVPSGYKDQ